MEEKSCKVVKWLLVTLHLICRNGYYGARAHPIGKWSFVSREQPHVMNYSWVCLKRSIGIHHTVVLCSAKDHKEQGCSKTTNNQKTQQTITGPYAVSKASRRTQQKRRGRRDGEDDNSSPGSLRSGNVPSALVCGCPPAQTSAAMTSDYRSEMGRGTVWGGRRLEGGGGCVRAAAAVISARHLPGRRVHYSICVWSQKHSSPILAFHRTYTPTCQKQNMLADDIRKIKIKAHKHEKWKQQPYQQRETAGSPGHSGQWQDESEGPSLHIHLQLQRAMAWALSSSPCLPPPSLSHPPVTLSTRLSRPLPSSLSHHLPLLSAELCVQPDAAWWVLVSAAGAARSRFVFALLYSERHNTANKTQECATFWIPLLYLLAFSSLGEGVIMNEMSGSEFDCRENA